MTRIILGFILLVGIIVIVLLIAGSNRARTETARIRTRLEAARRPIEPESVDFRELEGLPPPAARFFRTALTQGRPMVAGVRVRHRGTFNMGESADRWKPFTSDHKAVTQRPGFDWNARIRMMPGLPVVVHDAYVAGEGILHAAVLGLFTVSEVRGTEDLARGELFRFFAESVWYPTALLPSQGVRWDPVDERSARATLTDGVLSLTLLFTFGDAGLIDTVRADTRGRTAGSEIIPTPWEGRFWSYQERDGMRVPLDGEVAWILPNGPKPYWRGTITEIEYEFAR